MLTALAAGVVLLGAVSIGGRSADGEVNLSSPNRQVVATVHTAKELALTVKYRGQVVVQPSTLGIMVDGRNLGADCSLAGRVVTDEINERYATRGAHAEAVNHCYATTIPLASDSQAWQLEVRVYDDGVAYRYRVPGQGKRHVEGESSEWNLPDGTVVWHQSADNSAYEAEYKPDTVTKLPPGLRIMAPAALVLPGGAGYGLMTEANLVGYSDMSLQQVDEGKFQARFQYNPDGWDQEGEIVSPWRVTLLAPDLNALVNSDLIRNLCPPPTEELADATWIRPGRCTWHWLITGPPKLDEQKAWIDGAQQLGYEYHLIDDGWRDWNGGGDAAWKALGELVQYARSRGVDLWVWVDSKYVFSPADRAAYFRRAKDTGVVGLKIDFPHNPDTTWVRWYDDTLRDAAAARLMIDFHGAVKPTGRERTWPNEMTREAIRGREQGKLPSTHDTALPFLRYVQGHADYTPALLIPDRLGGSSLAHELAMPIVFTSPLLCMGDSPQHYLDSQASDVLKAIPAVWDETIVLPGSEIGRQAAFARRHGDAWFIGVINGPSAGQLAVDLKFLGNGKYNLVELADDPDRNDALVRSERTVTRYDTLAAPLRTDGGYAAWLTP